MARSLAQRKWEANHPEQVRLQKARYYAANRKRLNALARVRYKKNPAPKLANSRKWQLANREKFNLWHRDYQRRNRDKAVARRYGITVEELHAHVAAQQGLCPICGTVLVMSGKNGAAVDHCHKSTAVRAVLCSSCNKGLGFLRDDPVIIAAALKYIQSKA